MSTCVSATSPLPGPLPGNICAACEGRPGEVTMMMVRPKFTQPSVWLYDDSPHHQNDSSTRSLHRHYYYHPYLINEKWGLLE